MVNKTIQIFIYRLELTLIIDKDLFYIYFKYKTKILDYYGAVTLKDESKYRHYVVAFKDRDHLINIVHEVVHIKNYVFLDCCMQVDRDNDELDAYLTGWLFDNIFKLM